MLITKDYTDKNKTRYKCDMCNKELNNENVNKVSVKNSKEKNQKILDLCEHCLSKLISSIKKYSKKMEDK